LGGAAAAYSWAASGKPTLGELSMRNLAKAFLRSESGATAIEYGLIVALIAVVIIGAVTLVGTNMSTSFNTIASSI
jgi:pilus assembly protein Flp/PilA